MGASISDCRETCDEECDRERKCYVDQNEVQIGILDVTNYPTGTRVHKSLGRAGGPVADLSTALGGPGASSRSTATSSSYGPQRLQPQSVTWADGLFRHTGHMLGRFQLTPKASSFNATPPERSVMSFEQQMGAIRARGPPPNMMPPQQQPLYRR
mmetsp:Transcript_26253/g.57737  ORF Transcript_26253/g.57737 Transcript_26253/m.57737 type:complete len:155 (-) Transcript_26253:148-612(-)